MRHLSESQIGMYRRCSFAWSCRYVRNLKIPPSSPLLLGSSFDTAINLNYNHKIAKGKDEKVSVCQDCFAEEFDNGKGNVLWEESEKPEELKDTGVKTVEAFHKEICVSVEPKAVQIRDKILFENVDYCLSVVIDLVDVNGIVIDNKYTKKSWGAGKEFQELDPLVYSVWKTKGNTEESKFRFDIGIATKTPKTQQIPRTISFDEKMGFLKYVAYINDNIERDTERGVFLPNPTNMMCSKRYCGFWKICEEEWNIKIKD